MPTTRELLVSAVAFLWAAQSGACEGMLAAAFRSNRRRTGVAAKLRVQECIMATQYKGVPGGGFCSDSEAGLSQCGGTDRILLWSTGCGGVPPPAWARWASSACNVEIWTCHARARSRVAYIAKPSSESRRQLSRRDLPVCRGRGCYGRTSVKAWRQACSAGRDALLGRPNGLDPGSAGHMWEIATRVERPRKTNDAIDGRKSCRRNVDRNLRGNVQWSGDY